MLSSKILRITIASGNFFFLKLVGSLRRGPAEVSQNRGARTPHNAAALPARAGPLWVCEDAFDALALGLGAAVRALVFALAAEAVGQQQGRQHARQAPRQAGGGAATSGVRGL